MRHSILRILRSFLPVILLLITASFASAESHARIVRLSFVEGDVQIDQRDGRGYQRAFLNMPIGQGTRVASRADARAEIEFEDGSVVRMARDAEMEFSRLGLRDDGGKFTDIDLSDGTFYGDLKHHDRDEFTFRLGGHELTFQKPVRFRARADKAQVTLAVFKGELQVRNEGQSVAVKKNETITLDREDAGRYFLAKEVTADTLDTWDNDRRQFRDRYFSSSSYRYDQAYSYGFSDLAYYGEYFYVPNWGYVWRPYQAALTWDPYGNGAWVWYPGYGYVWVSSHPWGWAPYRYGSWVYVSSYGWCWRPPRRYQTWSPVVIVHNPPPRYVAPQVPVVHSGGAPPPPVVVVGNGSSGRERWYRELRDQDEQTAKKGSGAPSGGTTGLPPGATVAPSGKVIMPPAPPRKVVIDDDVDRRSPRVTPPPAGANPAGNSGKAAVPPAPPRKVVIDDDTIGRNPNVNPPSVGTGPASDGGKIIMPPAPPRRVVAEESAPPAPPKVAVPPAPPAQKRMVDDDSAYRPARPAQPVPAPATPTHQQPQAPPPAMKSPSNPPSPPPAPPARMPDAPRSSAAPSSGSGPSSASPSRSGSDRSSGSVKKLGVRD
jgi:uncharacterized protein DUF6600/FecR-like protein